MGQPFQSNYNEYQDAGRPGMIANGENWNAISRTIETAAGVGFGEPVARGSADRGAVAMATGLDFIGVTKRNNALDPADADKYAQYKEAAIVDEGCIFGLAGANVADGGSAFWHTVNKRWVDAAGTNIVAIPGVEYDNTVGNGGLVILRVRRFTA